MQFANYASYFLEYTYPLARGLRRNNLVAFLPKYMMKYTNDECLIMIMTRNIEVGEKFMYHGSNYVFK